MKKCDETDVWRTGERSTRLQCTKDMVKCGETREEKTMERSYPSVEMTMKRYSKTEEWETVNKGQAILSVKNHYKI